MATVLQTVFWNTFLELQCLNFDPNFTEACSQWSNWQAASSCSDNGLALNMRQAIVRVNDSIFYWRIYVSLNLNSVNTLRPRRNGRHFADDTSSAFSWMTMLEFRLEFHWICSLGSNLQYFSIGSDNGLAPTRRRAIIWTNDDLITDAYMRHLASMS